MTFGIPRPPLFQLQSYPTDSLLGVTTLMGQSMRMELVLLLWYVPFRAPIQSTKAAPCLSILATPLTSDRQSNSRPSLLLTQGFGLDFLAAASQRARTLRWTSAFVPCVEVGRAFQSRGARSPCPCRCCGEKKYAPRDASEPL